MKELARGTEKGLSGLIGIALPPRGGKNQPTFLRNIPALMEIEALLVDPSVEWRPEFEAKRDEVSLSLFGVNAAAVEPLEPHPDSFAKLRYTFGNDEFTAYQLALGEWYSWREAVAEYEHDIERDGADRYWKARRIIVTDDCGEVLRCFRTFSRQLFAAHSGALAGAKLTLDGTGRKAPQTVEEWTAALFASRDRWKPTR